MKHFLLHLMPYPKLPVDFAEKHESAWVWVPNELFDPQVMHRAYNDYIGQLAAADDMGFVIPECGHLIPLEKPDDFHRAVTAFLG